MVTNKFNVSVPDSHLQAIGQLTANFELLKDTLEYFIWNVIGDDMQLGQIITAHLSMRQICDTAYSVLAHRTADGQLLDSFHDLLKQVSGIGDRRNTIVHALWASGATGDVITRLKSRAKAGRGFEFSADEVSLGDIQRVADDIARLISEVIQFLIRFDTAAKGAAADAEQAHGDDDAS